MSGRKRSLGECPFVANLWLAGVSNGRNELIYSGDSTCCGWVDIGPWPPRRGLQA